MVCMPFELCVVNLQVFDVEKTTELASRKVSVFEAPEEGTLLIGGAHLHRGNIFTGAATKLGTKLGGFVEFACLVRPRLLCCVGGQGEVLLDMTNEEVVHRRKTTEHEVRGLIASADGRAVWIDSSPQAWVIDPDHASGYMKLKFKATSATDQDHEAIEALGITAKGRCLLAAADGGVAWTNRALRVIGEKFPRIVGASKRPLGIAGDERWVYVLRANGVLHRFLVTQPEPTGKGKAAAKAPAPPELPEAQSVRLNRQASCIAVVADGSLLLGGPQSDDLLGRLWPQDPEALDWEPLELGERELVEQSETSDAPAKKPDFTQVRSKLTGPAISKVSVDDVIGAARPFWVTRSLGATLERATGIMEPAEVLAGDALLLPAMFRLHEGVARPGLVVWPGAAQGRPIADLHLLTWGHDPREWLELDTPAIRKQGWSRREVFPLQVALAHAVPEVAGQRNTLPKRWSDRELFAALAKECKQLLKVLW